VTQSRRFLDLIFITGKYPRNLLKQQNYVVAESESFIVITGISPYRTLLLRLLLTPRERVLLTGHALK
jgi:hypothetical protein